MFRLSNRVNLVFFILFFVLLIQSLIAQESFEEWQSQQNRSFQAFMTQEDTEFARYLSDEWEQFQSFLESGVYDQPKLDEPPRTDAATFSQDNYLTTIGRKQPTDRSTVEPDPIREEELDVTYFGIPMSLPRIDRISEITLDERSPGGFSRYWRNATEAGADEFAQAINAVAGTHSLNGFATFQLIDLVAGHVAHSVDERTALTWYLMVKIGYDMRIAYNPEEIALLMPSENTLYRTSFIRVDDRRYYLLRSDGSPVPSGARWRTYTSGFSGSDKVVDLDFTEAIGVPAQMRIERLSFSYRRQEYAIEVPVNEYALQFLSSYPLTDWWVHFFPPTTSETRQALVSQLGRIVAGRTPAEAANILLRFVQTAFPYERDHDQFGVEKWQAPEEILYYRRSDCDDRSILYAYLLREVLGWDDVAILLYPGHLAVAVPQRRVGVSGDSVRVNGETYIVTDPTYIGADIGMAMPQYRNVHPEAHIVHRR